VGSGVVMVDVVDPAVWRVLALPAFRELRLRRILILGILGRRLAGRQPDAVLVQELEDPRTEKCDDEQRGVADHMRDGRLSRDVDAHRHGALAGKQRLLLLVSRDPPRLRGWRGREIARSVADHCGTTHEHWSLRNRSSSL
jgi:hypothetical protein